MTKAEATPKELRAKIMDCQSQEGNSRGRCGQDLLDNSRMTGSFEENVCVIVLHR